MVENITIKELIAIVETLLLFNSYSHIDGDSLFKLSNLGYSKIMILLRFTAPRIMQKHYIVYVTQSKTQIMKIFSFLKPCRLVFELSFVRKVNR